MSRKCLCCSKPLARQTCEYCGFVDVEVLTADAESFLAEEIQHYARSIVSSITDISVISFVYKWNEAKSRLEMDKKEELKIADGVECYQKIKWTSQNFGQLPVGKNITLDVSYMFRGARKQISCTIPTVQCNGFWKVGVAIDSALRLKVFLGAENNHTESAAIDLELK